MIEHRGEQPSVAVGTDGDMLEAPRGLSAARIDDDHPAPLVDRLQFVQRPRLRDDRHVRHHRVRSEEHTSELQSLMRISYAVFCLKKKTINHSQISISSFILHIKLNNTSHSTISLSHYKTIYIYM